MKKTLFACAAFVCALILALAMWAPAPTSEAAAKKDNPSADRPSPGQHALADLFFEEGSLAGTCTYSCGGTDYSNPANNVGDCACQCANDCGGTCTASGGGQTATCGPSMN